VAATGSGLTLPIDLRGARPGVCQPCTFWASGCCHRAADCGRSLAQRRRRVSCWSHHARGALQAAPAGGWGARAARQASRRAAGDRSRASPPPHAAASRVLDARACACAYAGKRAFIAGVADDQARIFAAPRSVPVARARLLPFLRVRSRTRASQRHPEKLFARRRLTAAPPAPRRHQGFGWAIAKQLAQAGCEIILGTWVRARVVPFPSRFAPCARVLHAHLVRRLGARCSPHPCPPGGRRNRAVRSRIGRAAERAVCRARRALCRCGAVTHSLSLSLCPPARRLPRHRCRRWASSRSRWRWASSTRAASCRTARSSPSRRHAQGRLSRTAVGRFPSRSSWRHATGTRLTRPSPLRSAPVCLRQVYPLDAVFDTPEDVPEDIKARTHLAHLAAHLNCDARARVHSALPPPC
jgi:hypothetical protein